MTVELVYATPTEPVRPEETCLRCPAVTVAWLRPDLADVDTMTELLCLEHFRDLVAARKAAAARAARDAARIFCECGNEKYLARPGRCARCTVGVIPAAAGPWPPVDWAAVRRAADGTRSKRAES